MTPPAVTEVMLVVLAVSLAAWAITYLIHSTLTIAAAWLLTRLSALAPTDEVRVWRFAVIAPIGTAFAQTFVTRVWSPLAVEMADAAPATLIDWRIGAAFVAVLLCAPVFLVSLWIVGRMQLANALGPRVLAPEHVRREVAVLAAAAGIRPPRVTISPTIAVPAAVGASEICLPGATFGTLPPDERRALLAHELGHLTRRDPVWLAVLTAVASVTVIQPLNRIAVRRLRAACERAADDFAVRVTGDPVALARALTSLTTLVLILSGGVSAAGSPIVERVRSILGSGRPPRRRRARWAWTAAALATLVFLAPGAGLAPESVANRLPWLTPSREEPHPRMLAVRRFEREWRDTLRKTFR